MKLTKALTISLIAHIVMIGLLAFNYQFSKVEIKQTKPGKQINAKAVNKKNVEQLVNRLKQQELDKKNKEIERLRKLKQQEEKARKKRIEEENKAKKAKQRQKDAERKRKQEEKKAADAKKKRVADEKARKEKIALEKKKAEEKKKREEAERKRKAKEAAEKKRKEEERKRKLAEEKAAQEALEKELEEQMMEEAAAIDAAKQEFVLTEVDKYNLLIRNKIKRNWIAPEHKGSCIFRINMAPGGLILGISVLSGDQQHCDTGRRAIRKSEPLPVSSDPDIFAVLKVRTFELENKEEKAEYDN